jgi:hypothetical protein
MQDRKPYDIDAHAEANRRADAFVAEHPMHDRETVRASFRRAAGLDPLVLSPFTRRALARELPAKVVR